MGLVLTVVVVACVAIYLVFTPERLTPIARQAAAKYITCEHEIGEVELTFFSTFPRFGLRADGLLLINPKAGAQNDTVVAAEHLTATVDVMEFLKNKNLHVHEAILDNARVHFFLAQDGTTNLTNVFVTEKAGHAPPGRSRRATGEMLRSIGRNEYREFLGGGSVDVYPQEKDSRGVRNATKAYVLNYGRGRGLKGDKFITGDESQAEQLVQEAMQAESDRLIAELE